MTGNMKVAASTNRGGLEDKVTEIFGRAGSFTVIEIENGDVKSVEVMENFAGRGSGAGISAAQLIADKGVEALLTGRVGPNALDALKSAGIKIYNAGGMSVRKALDELLNGKLSEINVASAGRRRGW
jgi:predicted Fe-Mo cluster-binding NifX family protein